MDKNKIVSKMNEYMGNISQRLKCEDDTDLTLFYCDYEGTTSCHTKAVAWFEDFDVKRFQFGATSNCNEAKEIVEKDVIKKFFQKGKELLQKKYTVAIISKSRSNGNRYINLNTANGNLIVSDNEDDEPYKARFTKEEIEVLKKDEDIAIDWDKAEVEEVDDDERED